jgi:peroxiredoxin
MSIFRRLHRWLGAHDGMTHIVAGNPAPNFSRKSLDGKELSLAGSLKEGPVVLAFFKVSCPVCKFTFPFLERLYQRYKSDNVTFLGISQDDVSASRDFAQDFGVTFPVLIDDASYTVSNAYGLSMVPTVFLVEPDGTVKISSMGFVKADLESIADALADRQNITRMPVFLKTESVPANKPG